MIKINKTAPAFTLEGIDPDGNEISVSLKALKGKKIVLYFYPRDNTPGCTTEACDFRDSFNRINETKTVIIGISPDSTASHLKFIKKQSLNFTLLSDPDKKIAALYGAYGEKKLYGKVSMGIIRSTVILDKEGRVSRIWSKVKVKGHVEEVVQALAEID